MPNSVVPVSKLSQGRLMALAGVMGFLMYGLGFSVPLLRREMDISRSTAAFHNIGFAFAITLTSLVIPKFISRYSPTFVMRTGWAIATVSLTIYAIGNSLWVTVPAMAMAGLGATLFNNTNAATVGHDAGTSTQILLRQNGISTICGAIAPTIIGTLISFGIPWRTTLLIFALVLGVISVKLVPVVPDRSPIKAISGSRHIDASLLLLVAFSFMATLIEAGTGAWILDLLISRDVSIGSAVLLAAVFSYGVAASRLGFSFTPRLSPTFIWLFSTAIAMLGLIVIVISHSASATMVGLIIAAFGIGPIGALALARSAASDKGSDVGIAAFVVGAGPAIGFGPWLVGSVSEKSGFSIAYSLPIMFLLIATGFFFAIARHHRS